MKCKQCKNIIDDDSIFCKFCGEKLIRTKREKKKQIKLPTPSQLPSGSWFARVTVDGKRLSVTANTYTEWVAKATAIQEGLIEEAKKPKKITLEECCNNYINARDKTCSPSTINGYRRIVNEHFTNYMKMHIGDIDWQTMINDETTKYSGKTIKNAWGLVSSSLKREKITPEVTLPQVIKKEAKWFTEKQLKTFLDAVKGHPCEIGALLALHGLRRSEIYALTKADIHDGLIFVEGAYTESEDGFVMVETNKNSESRRKVPIFIDRLQFLVDQLNIRPEETIMTTHPHTLYKQINKICEDNNIPSIGVHGCRKTYASACYRAGIGTRETMKLGGWSDPGTMEHIYIQVGNEQITEASNKLKDMLNNSTKKKRGRPRKS